jgi:hypothetical protein
MHQYQQSHRLENDIHSKGEERPKVNGGGNPYAVTAEGLQRQLQNLYHEIKSR